MFKMYLLPGAGPHAVANTTHGQAWAQRALAMGPPPLLHRRLAEGRWATPEPGSPGEQGSRGGVRRREAGIPTPACLHLPQVQAVQTAVCPDEGLSRSPPRPHDSQQASPAPSPRHHPSRHARPACPHQPASQPVPCWGRCAGPHRAPPLARAPAPQDLSCPEQRPRSVFLRSGPRVGAAGRCQRGRRARVRGVAAVLIFF